MSQDPKVVSIKPNLAARTAAGASALPAPVVGVRDLTVGYLQSALGEMFDKADDNLFEMADKAGSNAEQALFFEAMRNVRLQRHNIVKKACDALVLAAEQLGSEAPQGLASSSYELDTLTLVQPDELEETVAIDGMVNRASSRNQTGLGHLLMRVNSLVKKRLEERDNPFAPAALAEHFAEAMKALNLDIKVRLIIFKLYERYVFNEIDGLYDSLNESFIRAGVMPDLRISTASSSRRPVKPPGAAARAEGSLAGRLGENAEQQEILSMFSDLIGKWRVASGDVALAGLGAPGGVPMGTSELLHVLSDVTAESFAGETGQNGLRRHIQQLLHQQRVQTGGAKTVARVDDDVISLVSMLFDFILEDRELPAAVKALIARMQLPVLRVAIIDKSFFSRASHPARRLLNELSRATMGWNDHDDLRRDQLHALLEQIVEQLLAETEPDADLFDALHQRLTEFLRTEQRRSERVEQRTRDAEEGRARIKAARAEVAREINTMLVGRTLPVTVVDLLRDTWSQVMQMIFLREGGESKAWRHALGAAKAMVHSVQPVDQAGMALRVAQNRQIEVAVRGGLELLGLDAASTERHVQAIVVPQRAVLAAVAVPKDAEATGPKVVDITPAEAAADEPPVALEAVRVEQPVLEQEAAEVAPETIEDLPSVGAQRWVEGLGTGCWVQLVVAEGKAPQRCKLAAIISFSGKYIFVNRNGVKVAELSGQELAQCFDKGMVNPLDENQLFDRALESVIGNLRQLQART
ncbi:MAG: DUF1631 domain-containing protein [Pseudomonadaceae bacterium]